MKKILFITNSLGFGGAEKMLTFVANSLNKRGHSCCIINLNTVGKYINEKTQDIAKEIKIYTFDASEKKQGHIQTIKSIYRIAKEFSADVIVGFTSYPSLYAKVVGMMLGTPSIMSERGDPTRTKGNTIKAHIAQIIINSSSGGVFQTEGARDFYGRGLRKRGVVIPNPIFIDGEVPQIDYEQCEKSVVTVGRLDNFQKRYDVMLDAFRIFSEKYPDYVLKLYGRGSDEELIKEWVEEKDLCDKVKFLGLASKPMENIVNDGMFLITSDFEGISNSLLEAMAVGLPCVSTDHTPGGARLLITDHENGLLAPVGDSVAIATAMCEFAENPELARKCGENAKDVLVRFAPERIIDMWEEYINKVCK